MPCGFALVCADGTCAAGGKLDDACSTDGATAPQCQWVEGFWCNPDTHECKAFTPAPIGALCGWDAAKVVVTPCDHAGWCDKTGTMDGSGTCKARAKLGEACGDPGPTCDAAQRCLEGTCQSFDPAACK